MNQGGRTVLVDILGNMSYRKMISELRKESINSSDMENLSEKLKLREFFIELRNNESVTSADIPEILLTNWAAKSPHLDPNLNKQHLATIFRTCSGPR